MFSLRNKTQMPSREQTLAGRSIPMRVPERHFVNGNRIVPPFPEKLEFALFGLGCIRAGVSDARTPIV